MNNVNVKIKQCDDVDKIIESTAKKLSKKYKTTRKVNEHFLKKEKTTWQKILSISSTILVTLIVLFCLVFSFCNLVAIVQKTPRSIAGYSVFKIGSGSMVASGFNVGDCVTIKKVNTDSLKPNDIIAFYKYGPQCNWDSCTPITTADISTKSHYNLSFGEFFGFQSDIIKQAANSGAQPTFHHIQDIRVDENGVRWFRTYGSSNGYIDPWFIPETLILGAYQADNNAMFLSNTLQFVSSNIGMVIFIMLPFVILLCYALYSALARLQIAKLELDVIEQKRKITDKICVDNKIGYGMSKGDKIKVLAQATDEEKPIYVSLLWKNGEAPETIKKYCIKKQLMLAPYKKMIKINQKCEQMFKDNDKPTNIAKYYLTEKNKIAEELKKREELLNSENNKIINKISAPTKTTHTKTVQKRTKTSQTKKTSSATTKNKTNK